MSSAHKKPWLVLSLMTAALLAAAVFLALWGRNEEVAPAAAPAAIPASVGNWGLSFPTEGQAPTGNASPADLAKYDSYYLGDTSQKVIYLTFDCGYENGYTGQILDALKKHGAPAAFFVVGHMIESAPDICRPPHGGRGPCGGQSYLSPPGYVQHLPAGRLSEGAGQSGPALPADHRPAAFPVLPSAPGKVQRGKPEAGAGTGV